MVRRALATASLLMVIAVGGCEARNEGGPSPADELATLLSDPMLTPPPDATEVGRMEQARRQGPMVDLYPAVHVLFQSPHPAAEVISHYLDDHGAVLDDRPDVEPPGFTYTKYHGFDGKTSRSVFVSEVEEPPPGDFGADLSAGMKTYVRVQVAYPGEPQ